MNDRGQSLDGGVMEKIPRRTFFARMIGFIAGLIGTVLAIPLVGTVVSPAYRRRARDWAEAGLLSQLTPGQPKELSYVVSLQDGWFKTSAMKSVWAVVDPDGVVAIFSPLCPHLGCGYRWNPADLKFMCPCHNSVFDIHGNVLSGPSPRPLDRLPVKIESDHIFIIYKEYKSGTSKQVEL